MYSELFIEYYFLLDYCCFFYGGEFVNMNCEDFNVWKVWILNVIVLIIENFFFLGSCKFYLGDKIEVNK